MKLHSLQPQQTSRIPTQNTLAKAEAKIEQTAVQANVDSLELSANDSPSSKALGTIFAGVGAVAGRLSIPLGAAAVAGSVGAAALGPIGAIGLGAIGLVAGVYSEFKNLRFEGVMPVGRMIGGFVGGVLGAAIGKGLDLLGINVASETMEKETKGFSLSKLWSRVSDVSYTSHETIDEATLTRFKDALKPGDVIVTNHDNYMDIEIPSMLAGVGGNWSHTAIYTGDGKAIEALNGEKVFENTVDKVMGINHHVKILRPKYAEGQAEQAVENAKALVGKPYEMAFNLHSDEKFGCVEVVYKAVKRAAPQLDVNSHKLFGKEWLSHKVFTGSSDMDIIEDTGSSMAYNYLSKFS